jgi:hypothetical protein
MRNKNKEQNDPMKQRIGQRLIGEQTMPKTRFFDPKTIASDSMEDLAETIGLVLSKVKRGSLINMNEINRELFTLGLIDGIKKASEQDDMLATMGMPMGNQNNKNEKKMSFIRKAIRPSEYPAQTATAIGMATLADRIFDTIMKHKKK